MSEPESIDAIIRRLLAQLPEAGGEDEAPPDPPCPKCSGLLFVYGPNWERTPCSCQAEAVAQRLERAWGRCGFEDRHLRCRLETHPIALEGAMPDLIAELLCPTPAPREGAEDLPGWRRSWLLHGQTGHGKTGLAAGYAYRLLHQTGESVFARTVPDLLDELKATYDPRNESGTEAALLTRYTECGLLVLDEFGAEQLKVRDDGSSWALDRLFTMVSRRHARELPLFLTSNLSPEELLQRMGKVSDVMGQRIMWRILESCAGNDHVRLVKHRNLRAGGGR